MFAFCLFQVFKWYTHFCQFLWSILADAQGTEFFSTPLFPRAVQHNVDYAVYTLWLQINPQFCVLTFYKIEIEIFVPNYRTVGVVHYRIVIDAQVVCIGFPVLVGILGLYV